MATMFFPVLICGIAVFVGLAVLQVFLSRREGRWPGLVLPIVSFGISVLATLGVALFSIDTGGAGVEAAIVGSAVYVFLLYNIPTAVLLAIYAACRGRRGKRRALEKMSVQDL